MLDAQPLESRRHPLPPGGKDDSSVVFDPLGPVHVVNKQTGDRDIGQGTGVVGQDVHPATRGRIGAGPRFALVGDFEVAHDYVLRVAEQHGISDLALRIDAGPRTASVGFEGDRMLLRPRRDDDELARPDAAGAKVHLVAGGEPGRVDTFERTPGLPRRGAGERVGAVLCIDVEGGALAGAQRKRQQPAAPGRVKFPGGHLNEEWVSKSLEELHMQANHSFRGNGVDGTNSSWLRNPSSLISRWSNHFLAAVGSRPVANS